MCGLLKIISGTFTIKNAPDDLLRAGPHSKDKGNFYLLHCRVNCNFIL